MYEFFIIITIKKRYQKTKQGLILMTVLLKNYRNEKEHLILIKSKNGWKKEMEANDFIVFKQGVPSLGHHGVCCVIVISSL